MGISQTSLGEDVAGPERVSRLYRDDRDRDRDCVHTLDHRRDDHICGSALGHRHTLGHIRDHDHNPDHDRTFLRRPSEAHNQPAAESLKWP